MRKLFLTALALCLFSAAWAEDADHSFGIQIGFAQPIYRLNSPTMMGQSRDHYDKTAINGFKIGAVYDGNIIGGFGVSMGLNYTFATGHTAWDSYGYTTGGKPITLPMIDYSTNYIYNEGEIFVDWQYKFEIAKQTFLILYSGPTIQYGSLNATDYFRDKATGGNVPMTFVVWSYEDKQDEYLRHLNVTWGVGAGFQYQRYFLRGGYDFGLINPYKEASFGAWGYLDNNNPDDRRPLGRLDQWQIKIGMYLFRMD